MQTALLHQQSLELGRREIALNDVQKTSGRAGIERQNAQLRDETELLRRHNEARSAQEVIALQQQIGSLRHELGVKEKALAELAERLVVTECEAASADTLRSEVLALQQNLGSLQREAASADTLRSEVLALQQNLGSLQRRVASADASADTLRSEALALQENLGSLQLEAASARALRLEALRKILDEHWESRSWRLLRPFRNMVRRLGGLPKEERPAIQSNDDAERWIWAIRDSTSWELLGPLRALSRVFQRSS
jgi:hypothetical protein